MKVLILCVGSPVAALLANVSFAKELNDANVFNLKTYDDLHFDKTLPSIKNFDPEIFNNPRGKGKVKRW